MDLEERINEVYHVFNIVQEEPENFDLEKEIQDSKPEIFPSPQISYSLPPEAFPQQEYGAPSINIEELWYGTKSDASTSFELEDEYWTSSAVQDVQEEMLTEVEAAESMMQVQYEAAANTLGTVSFEERRKLDLFIMFNSAIFRAWESQYAVTRDVNYAPPR